MEFAKTRELLHNRKATHPNAAMRTFCIDISFLGCTTLAKSGKAEHGCCHSDFDFASFRLLLHEAKSKRRSLITGCRVLNAVLGFL
jgi:hypothetical protein